MIFLFFNSSLACLKPELFEVWEINVRQLIIIANGINFKQPKLQTALARVLDQVHFLVELPNRPFFFLLELAMRLRILPSCISDILVCAKIVQIRT